MPLGTSVSPACYLTRTGAPTRSPRALSFCRLNLNFGPHVIPEFFAESAQRGAFVLDEVGLLAERSARTAELNEMHD